MPEYKHLVPNPGLSKEELLSILNMPLNLTPEAVADAIVANNKKLSNLINGALDSVINP